MKKLLAITAVVLSAAITGALLAKPLLAYLMEAQAVKNGPWRTSTTTGSANANPWERAAVALAGLYALTPDEAVYFTAFTDSSGAPLKGECRYRVRGTPPPARWWSLTVYGADHYLVPNTAKLYARHAGNLPLHEGRFALALFADATMESGLPIPPQGPFSLTLRVYNPAPQLRAQLADVALPVITLEHCS